MSVLETFVKQVEQGGQGAAGVGGAEVVATSDGGRRSDRGASRA